jgi:hypothetical protein
MLRQLKHQQRHLRRVQAQGCVGPPARQRLEAWFTPSSSLQTPQPSPCSTSSHDASNCCASCCTCSWPGPSCLHCSSQPRLCRDSAPAALCFLSCDRRPGRREQPAGTACRLGSAAMLARGQPAASSARPHLRHTCQRAAQRPARLQVQRVHRAGQVGGLRGLSLSGNLTLGGPGREQAAPVGHYLLPQHPAPRGSRPGQLWSAAAPDRHAPRSLEPHPPLRLWAAAPP